MKKRNALPKVLLILLSAFLFLIGAAILMKPTINRIEQEAEAEEAVDIFLRENNYERVPRQEISDTTPVIIRKKETMPEETPYPELLAAMKQYNAEIYANRQAGLSDPWAYTSSVFDLAEYGLDSETVGVLAIPAMDYEEPIYLGATSDHLSRGAAQLSISSMPIGGNNTNCVLAGHRGWNGELHFRYIERLEVGDQVFLTNLWDTLIYEVVEIKIIQPWQPEHLLIQEGRDLLTLITCHPYGSGGKYRYVVYCEERSSLCKKKLNRKL